MNTATPDLQAILATLAQSTPPIQGPPPVHSSDNTATSEHVEQSFLNPPTQFRAERTEDPRPRPQSRNSATASPKPIDPATITTWQDGLRCVTKIAAQNAQFSAAIRKMMADQKRNELRWYSERQALKQTQASRASSSAQAQSILQSLGGNAAVKTGSEDDINASKEAELATFDQKIYAAQLEMETAMTAELKGLGVPFFGTDRSLVVPDGEEPATRIVTEQQPRWSPVITEGELIELRRRIVRHLEDLYRG